MAKHILIETPQGEQVLVLDLRGHEDCKVIEEGVTPPRVPGCERRDGRWRVKDKEATKDQLLTGYAPKLLAQKLKALEARLDKAGL